ncbi:MAG: HDIG domain-containing protein [Victivallales bacterium]|nr:HDIG domain-containing protein [Victivallales bacterium]
MPESPQQPSSPQPNAYPGLEHSTSGHDKIVLSAIFCVLWALCGFFLLTERDSRQELPDWLEGMREKLEHPLQYDMVAESTIYTDSGFSYLVHASQEQPISLQSGSRSFPLTVPDVFAGLQKSSPLSIPPVEVTGEARIIPFPFLVSQDSGNRPLDIPPLFHVLPDEPIVLAGEPLATRGGNGQPLYTSAFYRLLAWTVYQELREKNDNLLHRLYASLLAGVLLLGFFYGLQALSAEACSSASRMLLCTTCIVMHLILLWLSCFLCHRMALGSNFFLYALLPGSLAPALASHLLGRRTALCLSLLLATLSPVLVRTATPFQFFISMLALSLIGTIAYQNIQRRVQFLYSGLGIWALGICTAAFFVLLRGLNAPWQNGAQHFWTCLVALTGANVFAVLLGTLLLPPMLEWIFDVHTVFTLNELNNRDHQLLEQLRQKAPGTYEHSLAVASIAAEEARAIGDDPKLAEACAYFHDIGKLSDPGKFTENLAEGEENPHDRITPLESCAVIREHVRHGYELACKYHLPRPIREACAQHHGNSLMAGFYEKARREAAASGQPAPPTLPYSYDAPRPTSRMVVLIELADICEAAVRAKHRCWLKQDIPVTGDLIRKTVLELIQAKAKERQFDCADITLQQLHLATESVVNSLCTIHHARTEYLHQGDTTDPTAPTQTTNGN